MMVNPQDRLSYFKGILLLSHSPEMDGKMQQEDLRKIAELLKFDSLFYDFALNQVINYLQILNDLPAFSCEQMTRIFVKDSLRIAVTKKILNPGVLYWLLQVAVHNQLDLRWFFEEIFDYLKPAGEAKGNTLEIESYLKSTALPETGNNRDI